MYHGDTHITYCSAIVGNEIVLSIGYCIFLNSSSRVSLISMHIFHSMHLKNLKQNKRSSIVQKIGTAAVMLSDSAERAIHWVHAQLHFIHSLLEDDIPIQRRCVMYLPDRIGGRIHIYASTTLQFDENALRKDIFAFSCLLCRHSNHYCSN